MLGMRVARQLEQPSNEPLVFTDIAGRATTVPAMDNTGVTGEHTSSEGKKGDAVWGTRGRWTMLAGTIGRASRSRIAIVDHPKNPGFPTYWHARGYGLFAANPLGQKIFSEGRETMNFTLEPGASATFRYRVDRARGKASADRHRARSFAAFSRRSRSIHVGLIGAGNISDTHARRCGGDSRRARRGRVRARRATRASALAATHGAAAYDALDAFLESPADGHGRHRQPVRAARASTASRRAEQACTCWSRSRSTITTARADALIAEAGAGAA